MKILEHDAKALLSEAEITIPRGIVVHSAEDAASAAREVGPDVAVKAQILEGGRGKRGFVLRASSPESAGKAFGRIKDQYRANGVGNRGGVFEVLVEEWISTPREMYVSIAFDAVAAEVVAMLAPEGGVDVEDAVRSSTELHRMPIPLAERETLDFLAGLTRGTFGDSVLEASLSRLFYAILDLYCRYDAELIEINPLGVTDQGHLTALDARVVLDDHALFRHSEFEPTGYENDLEGAFASRGAHFVELGGEIGVISPGAGLNMALIDWIEESGKSARCMLDITGVGIADWDALFANEYPAHFASAMEFFVKELHDSGTDIFLVNVTSGGSPVDGRVLAIVDAVRDLDVQVVVHAAGNGQDHARAILKRNGFRCPKTLSAAVEYVCSMSRR